MGDFYSLVNRLCITEEENPPFAIIVRAGCQIIAWREKNFCTKTGCRPA